MALTRIVKGMLAGSSVTPENLVNTSTYTVGGLINTGDASIAGTLSIGSTLTVTSGLGLKIDGIALSSATNLVYYDPVTKQVTYAGPGPSGNPFNQTLNTNSNVTFSGVQVNGRITATSITIGGQTLGGAGTGLTLGTLTATNVITNFLNVNSTATWYTPLGFEAFKIKAIDSTGNFGRFSTNLNFEMQPVGSVVVAGAGSSITGDIQDIRSDLGRGLTLSTRQRFSNGTFSSIRSAVIIGGETNVTATTLEDITLRGNAVALDVNRLLPFPTGPGTTIRSVDIGSTSSRFNVIYARSVNVLNNTIYFEDEAGTTTSTLSLTSGVVSVDGTQYVDQAVTTSSTVTFAGMNIGSTIEVGDTFTASTTAVVIHGNTFPDSLGIAGQFLSTDGAGTLSWTTSTSGGGNNFDSLTAVNATITNLTVIGTMTTLNVTTENVTTENIVTQNFADGTSQTTAWTGTVAYSNVTGVPTLPNQSLDTTSNVSFNSVRSTKTISAGGYPLDAGGTATTFASTFSGALVVSNQGGGIAPIIYFRGYGQNRPTSGATTAGNPGLLFDSSRGTNTAPTAVGSGDLLGGYFLGGYDGTRFASEQNIWSGQLGHTAAEAFAGTASTTTNAGTNFAINTQPPAIRLTTTSKQRFFQQSWTAASGANAPQLNLFMGSGVDGTAPSLVSADGSTTYTGYGRSNIFFHNSLMNIFGVPTQDSAPDNATLTATNVLNFVTGRRSGVAGRRNIVQSGDDLGIIGFRGQTANNGTGAGARGAVIFSQALETFSGTVNGASVGIRTVNSGTNIEAERLLVTDSVMRHSADSHVFRDKTGSFTALTVSTSTVKVNATSLTFPDNTTQTTAASAPGQTSVYARNALPAGVTGLIITISDSGSDANAPAGNYAPAYWDPDANDWTYIGNSNSVTPI